MIKDNKIEMRKSKISVVFCKWKFVFEIREYKRRLFFNFFMWKFCFIGKV